MSVLITGGTVVTADRSYRADVYCEDGIIKAIGENLEVPARAQKVDAGGAYVMPGGIDPHTHMQLPFMGQVATEDFFTGTAAGLAGGTTMIIDFCIPSPQQSLLDAYEQWLEWAKKAVADYSFHVAITWWSDGVAQQMAAITDRGVNSFKHFMAYKGAIMVDDEVLFKSFSRCRELGALPMVHAENGDAVYLLQQQLLNDGITGPEGHALSRPPEVEGEAANRAIMIAATVGVPLYIVHTSCKQAHDAIKRARENGQRVYGEPLIQHLTLDDSVYQHTDWEHAAGTGDEPAVPLERASEVALGRSDVRLAAGRGDRSLLLHARAEEDGDRQLHDDPERHGRDRGSHARAVDRRGRTGRLTMNEFVAVTSSNAAKIYNIYPRKGAIEVDADADLVVWDPNASKTISAKTHHMNLDVNVFEGMRITGLPAVTLSQGKVVWQNGQLKVERGAGRCVPRPTHHPAFLSTEKLHQAGRPKPVKRRVSLQQTP